MEETPRVKKDYKKTVGIILTFGFVLGLLILLHTLFVWKSEIETWRKEVATAMNVNTKNIQTIVEFINREIKRAGTQTSP